MQLYAPPAESRQMFSRVGNSRFWLTAQELSSAISSLLKMVLYRFGCLRFSSANLQVLTAAEGFGVSEVGNKILSMFVSSMFVVWRRLVRRSTAHTTNAAFATTYALFDDLYSLESFIYFMLCAAANFLVFSTVFLLVQILSRVSVNN